MGKTVFIGSIQSKTPCKPLVRNRLVSKKANRYKLNLEISSTGESAVDLFTPEGSAAMIDIIHRFICSCRSEDGWCKTMCPVKVPYKSTLNYNFFLHF